MSVRNRFHCGAALGLLVNLGFAGAAEAQTALAAITSDVTGFDLSATRVGAFRNDRNVSVQSRPRPGYEQIPFRLDTFLIRPSVTAGLSYDSNLLASNTIKEASAIATIEPTVVVQSDWSRNYLQLVGDANIERHTSHTQEDRNEWLIGPRGRLDIDQSFSLQAGAAAERQVEPRTATTAPITDRPIAFNRYSGFFGGTKDLNRLRLVAFGQYEDLEYHNSTLNGLFSDQQYRDRKTASFKGQAEYSLAPGYEFLATAVIDHRNSTHATPGEPERDSDGVDVQAGTLFDIGGIATGSATVGYIHRNYSNPLYPTVTGPTFAAGVEYYATPLITVRFLAARNVEDSTVPNSGGFLSSTATLHADYELERNIILSAGGGYGRNDFKGIDRKDDRFSADALARWLLNRALEADLRYAYQNQDSYGVNAGRTFNDHRIGLFLTYRGNL